jgi:hypothetical protein
MRGSNMPPLKPFEVPYTLCSGASFQPKAELGRELLVGAVQVLGPRSVFGAAEGDGARVAQVGRAGQAEVGALEDVRRRSSSV